MTQPYKIYRVFAGDLYYPNGGMRDLQFAGTHEDCYKFLADHNFDWWEIVNSDFETVETIENEN